MTPSVLRDRLISQLSLRPGMRVLDPGVGTGELLRGVLDQEPTCDVTGWDIDPEILTFASELIPEAELESRSALDPFEGRPFDLVIGNPPYFQFRASPDERERFKEVISGRPNIFALFFKASLDLLGDGGTLAFVVPPSMNNGAYFEGLRTLISETCSIDFLEIASRDDLFADAQTPVQLMVLTKGSSGSRFTFTRKCPDSGFERTIFTEDPLAIEAMFSGRKSLFQLGFRVSTGRIVWNQVRDRLRQEPDLRTAPLIWAHNLRDGEVNLQAKTGKPPYVLSDSPQIGPAVVVNRIVGSVGSGALRCGFVPDGMKFEGENHTNVITRNEMSGVNTSWDHLVMELTRSETAGRIRMITGNSQISATELEHLLPLDCSP